MSRDTTTYYSKWTSRTHKIENRFLLVITVKVVVMVVGLQSLLFTHAPSLHDRFRRLPLRDGRLQCQEAIAQHSLLLTPPLLPHVILNGNNALLCSLPQHLLHSHVLHRADDEERIDRRLLLPPTRAVIRNARVGSLR